MVQISLMFLGAWLSVASTYHANAQTDHKSASASLVTSSAVAEIADPSTGSIWVLCRNSNLPGGPGRLMQSPHESHRALCGLEQDFPDTLSYVIRAGDHLVVEEDSASVHARLEALALGPAALGSEFEVRLIVGRKEMRAKALGPGRAAIFMQRQEHGEVH